MQEPFTILFASAGRRNQLMDCFREDAAELGLRLRMLAADRSPGLSPACQRADHSFTVPPVVDADYVPALLDLCRTEGVALVVPTIDTELGVLSRAASRFTALGTRVLVSSAEAVALAGDKQATAQALAAAGIATPRTLLLDDYRRRPDELRTPVIVKPKGGSASIGIVRPRSPAELAHLSGHDHVVQESLPGREYTVNVYFDLGGTLRCAVPHVRLEVRAGEVSKGRTERVPALLEAASRLPAVLPGAVGPLCFQAMVNDSGACAVFEINARFGGGYPLAHRAGARMSLWIMQELTGRASSARDDWKPGVTMLRYDQAVFIDA